jgi:hypothetical protein
MEDNMSKIKLDYDQIDQIIISELKNTYQSLVEDLGTVDVYDSIEDHKNSIESFKHVLSYYMLKDEFDRFISQVEKNK